MSYAFALVGLSLDGRLVTSRHRERKVWTLFPQGLTNTNKQEQGGWLCIAVDVTDQIEFNHSVTAELVDLCILGPPGFLPPIIVVIQTRVVWTYVRIWHQGAKVSFTDYLCTSLEKGKLTVHLVVNTL